MKLYYSPGACSLSPHIVLREAGFDFSIERVNLRDRQTESGQDFAEINPKGYVPALVLDNGELLTEGPAIVQYLADQAPEKGLLPPVGTLERARVQEWLTFIGTELHKSFSPLFNPAATPEMQEAARAMLARRLPVAAAAVASRPYLVGEGFTVADAYLFVVLGWAPMVKVDLAAWPSLAEFSARIAARPSVQAALEAEGLKKG
ncbi:glutathione transferase GstA [Zoogloea dura]|jgi:glutathione S-transferase|uniref:Glutathione transferase GstA n=1 Tax=Zoogloea dura TaxID=2728840 RepID=A0A848FXF4_9RHOO|nr:glutathione transferase GstA [Zoogloea dura]NML24548.1 glutathione transferase GstA [Zoogloea dura]